MLKIRKNVNTAPLSTFKIGNRARYFCEVKNDNELLDAITVAEQLAIPYKIIAGGSNVVFPDKPLNCLLVKVISSKLKVADGKIISDAGVPLSRVIAVAVKNGFKGLETLSGIPGTLGGAIVGNAGAYGHSISEAVESVEILDGKNKRWLTGGECSFAYRESIFKERPYIVLRTVLKFQKGDPGELKKTSKNIIQVRLKKYKPGLCCPGSFFKNVLVKDVPHQALKLIDPNKIMGGKIPTGYLLEKVGARGMRRGGIKIADFHGNLFINDGRARAADVKSLSRILKSKIKRKFGINLEEEVRYL